MTKKIPLLISAFLEGAALMALELISSRMLAVGFGSSLKVWAILLALTLLGLALGYYLGGKYATKRELRIKILLGLSLFSAIFLGFYPVLGSGLVNLFAAMSLVSGTFLSAMVLVFVPLCVFGMFSPLIIDVLNENHIAKSGSTAGIVYGISTLGGILATFLFGLYLIPESGIQSSCLILSGMFVFIFATIWLLGRSLRQQEI